MSSNSRFRQYSIECTYKRWSIYRITQLLFLVELKLSIFHYLYFERLNRTYDTVLGAASRTSDTWRDTWAPSSSWRAAAARARGAAWCAPAGAAPAAAARGHRAGAGTEEETRQYVIILNSIDILFIAKKLRQKTWGKFLNLPKDETFSNKS